MKNTFLFLIMVGLLAVNHNIFAQNDDSTPEMSEGPQTLPAETSATEGDDTQILNPPTDETATEVKPEETQSEDSKPEENKPPAPQIEQLPVEESKPQTQPVESTDENPSPVPEKKKKNVVSEDELLKPIEIKVNKEEPKVRASKINESEIYIQEAEKFKLNDIYKNLRLNDVIEQGLRKNYDQNIRDQKDQLNELKFSGAKEAFWMPNLKISLETEKQKISTLRSSSRSTLTNTPNTPSGVASLSLGEYTVFNWGKDFAAYLNTKTSYVRQKQIFDETKREFKLDLINKYFSLVAAKNIEKIRQDQLRHASFVYRLNKEKITIGKTSKQDYYQARSEYLIAQNDYHQARMNSDLLDEGMAFLIADEVGTKYVLIENLDYRRLRITLEDTLQLSDRNNPAILTNKTELENSQRSYEIALKENMPLPKFTVNLGAFNKRFDTGLNSTLYETDNGGGNVELVASVSATWDLIGEDGLLNSRKLAVSRIQKELASKGLEKSKHFAQSMVRQTFKNVLSLQNQMVILEARLPSVQKTFDVTIENYLASKTKYIDFHYALKELTETKILYEQTKLAHLQDKLTLAKLAGIEDFPGENFEQLAVKIKGK